MVTQPRFTSGLLVTVIALALGGCVTDKSGGGGGAGTMTRPFVSNVDPQLANACAAAAANRYYLPTHVIRAIDSNKASDGSTVVKLKVDLRDAVCTVNASGSVRSVIDTTPKSADQIEAEKAAAEGRKL